MDYEALRVPLHYDLRPLAALLAGKGIPHQISEWQGAQVIWVIDAASAELVESLHRRVWEGFARLSSGRRREMCAVDTCRESVSRERDSFACGKAGGFSPIGLPEAGPELRFFSAR